VLEEVCKIKGVPISAQDVKRAAKVEFFGAPIAQMPQYVNLTSDKFKGDLLPGIPAKDTLNNEVNDWMMAVANVFQGDKMNLYVKGDNAAAYPTFKHVIDAFKKNDLMKFSVITSQEGLPPDSEGAKAARAAKKS
jgi:hypothetical protein